MDGAAASHAINDVPAIRGSDVLKEDCSTIVAANFVGFKPFFTNMGFPENDGYSWRLVGRKTKGAHKYQCVDCNFVMKRKFQTKKKLRQKRGNIRHELIGVFNEVVQGEDCRPKIGKCCLTYFHLKE